MLHLAVHTSSVRPSIGLFCVSHCNINGGNRTVGMKEGRKEREGNNDWIVSGVLLPPFPATAEGGEGGREGERRGREAVEAVVDAVQNFRDRING